LGKNDERTFRKDKRAEVRIKGIMRLIPGRSVLSGLLWGGDEGRFVGEMLSKGGRGCDMSSSPKTRFDSKGGKKG